MLRRTTLCLPLLLLDLCGRADADSAQCDEVRERLREIRSRLRAGYTTKQGRQLRERQRRLEERRRRECR